MRPADRVLRARFLRASAGAWLTEVLRRSQRPDDEVWWVEVDRHLDEQHRGRRICTSYEQGVIGSELWAVRHHQRIRLEIDQREVARAAQRKNRTW